MSADSASVLAWREELSALEARLGELFVRAEPRRQAGLYLEGLLSAAKRKNGWQLAEQIGDTRPWRTQRVLSHVLWDQDAARNLCRDYVIEHLGAADGVLIVDETGFLKKGEHSVGVARQWSGASSPSCWPSAATRSSGRCWTSVSGSTPPHAWPPVCRPEPGDASRRGRAAKANGSTTGQACA